jgi:DNA polymerase-3 subunit delta
MVAVKSGEVERFLARPDRAPPIVLLYGPDAGLVRERAQALIGASVDDPADPFQLSRLQGDDLIAEPTRLVEEANTMPLLGGRRAVSVRAGGHNIAPAVEPLIASPANDYRVVIEAGNLRRNAPLRVLCERAKNAVALPCYSDSGDALTGLIDEEMRANGLTVSPEARAALVPLLGGDRLASRQELRKLAVFAAGKRSVELADVIAVVSDASALELDEIIDAAFAGRKKELEAQLGKARTAALSPDAILWAALRHVAQLHKARFLVDKRAPVDAALGSIAPFLSSSRKAAIKAALALWTSPRLVRTMTQLADAQLTARRQSNLAQLVAHRALLAIAERARPVGWTKSSP